MPFRTDTGGFEPGDDDMADFMEDIVSPFVTDWGLDSVPHYKNESWVFVLGRDGRITHRFEGYATFEEFEVALLEVLER